MTQLSSDLFYVLAAAIVFFSLLVLMLPNPVHAALSLAGTMLCLGFLYFQLEAYFIAGVQLIVYAGAVMVLFVMVLMLFDLKKEDQAVGGGRFGNLLKTVFAAMLTGILLWAIKESIVPVSNIGVLATPEQQVNSVKQMSYVLFTKYLFAFEALGVLLLLIAIGVVAVARTKGGTHARN